MFTVGITGTNGKTSCSHWIAQALTELGTPCAIIGTLGAGLPGKLEASGFTTPDAPQLQRRLAQLRATGARAAAIEVSSHGLQQGRVNGTVFAAAIFTNLSRDHLDYHPTFDAYRAAKARLFDWPSLRYAIINYDDAVGAALLEQVRGRVRTVAYGIADETGGQSARAPGELRADSLVVARNVRATNAGIAFSVVSEWGNGEIEAAVLGAFNASNLLAVLATLLIAEIPFDAALKACARAVPVVGRMQHLGGDAAAGEPLVIVDHAHTPDALEQALIALRPVACARGGALVCVFGCGGNRDTGKRAPMGAIAARLADRVVLTSDNPRFETPAAIIDDIARGIPRAAHAVRLEDRARAILQTIRTAACEDVILIAGKGHETTLEIQGHKRPFSDQDHVCLALAARTVHQAGYR